MEKRRINVTKAPFNYRWPNGRVTVVRETGVKLLSPDFAQAVIDGGAGEEFDPKKPKRRTSSPRPRTGKPVADAADKGQSDRMGDESLARDGRADDQRADDDAE